MMNQKDDTKGKERHDLESALFRIRHIHSMLTTGRKPEDFNEEILASFQEAIETIDSFIRRPKDS